MFKLIQTTTLAAVAILGLASCSTTVDSSTPEPDVNENRPSTEL
ncbi:MAG: hypothetical protein ACSHX7_08335 [Luteolibacter sp.]